MDLSRLAEPFPAADLEWRILQAGVKNGKPWGKCVAYVTNRAIQERLDDVCGPPYWCNEFVQGPEGGVLCGISVKCDGEWVKKWDGAENTEVEKIKGGLSAAMKRAAVQWGIGRYLYDLEEGWASFQEGGPYTAKIEGQFYRWAPPKLPAWALPPDDHQRLLTFIKSVGERSAEPMQATIRDRWEAAKRDRREARALAALVEEGTGEKFTP